MNDSRVEASFFQLAWNADSIVQLVMLGLIVVSVASWAIMVEKSVLFATNRRHMKSFEKAFWSGNSLEELYQALAQNPGSSLGVVFVAAMREWRRAFEGERPTVEYLPQRVERVMAVAIAREVAGLEKRTPVLATIGATAPFVGLLGTVWGIMSSFQGIAVSRDTSLAVVAPGIAEALLATALGLFAAIPAVIAYNRLTHDMHVQTERLENFADEFSTLLSRQLEKQMANNV